jgi:predicted membrane metal-binding protein
MILLLPCAYLLGSFAGLFFSPLFDLSLDLHGHCLAQAPPSFYQAYFQALVCGANLTTDPTYSLKTLGLFHLFVVSGAHLSFLDRFLRWGLPRGFYQPTRLLILFLFVLICQVRAPVFRAWLSVLLQATSRRFQLNILPQDILLLSLTVCLGFDGSPNVRFSLLLSWLAGLGLLMGRNPLQQSLLIFIFMSPLLEGITPWSILINAFGTPVLGLLLFPLSLISFIIPSFYLIVEPLWHAFLQLSDLSLSLIDHQVTPPLPFRSLHIWFFGLLIHLILSLRRRGLESI